MQKIMIIPEKYHHDRNRGESLSHRVGRVIQDRGFVGFAYSGGIKVANKGKGLLNRAKDICNRTRL